MAVAETGVPGLDSDDSFCSAWSRFGGSWQVLVQAGAALDPAEVARLEVVASALVEDAYNDVFAAWPAELETERDVVADGYFGAFRRRSDDAAFALSNAGATDDDRTRLATAWADALERYDPAAPAVDVAVPDELGPLVDTAAGAFAQQRVPLPDRPDDGDHGRDAAHRRVPRQRLPRPRLDRRTGRGRGMRTNRESSGR